MKKVLLGIAGGLLVLAVAAGVFFKINFVCMDDKIYNKNETNLFIYMPETRISELNRCKKLETLHASKIDNEQIEKMRVFEELLLLDISNRELEINAPEIEKINQFPKLLWLDLTCSKADLSNLRNDSITQVHLSGGEITFNDNGFLSGCPNLETLRIHNTSIGDFITPERREALSGNDYTLVDSSFLSDLDSVKKLILDTIIVEDISGILEMDSLEQITVIEGSLSEEHKKLLEDKGVRII